MFFSENVQIPVLNSPLSQTWVDQLIVQGILMGNNIYDSVTQDIPQTFGVSQALRSSTALNNVVGGTTVGPEMPVSIIPEASPAANLPFHRRTALTQGKTTSIYFKCQYCYLHSNHTRCFPLRQSLTWEQWSPCSFSRMAVFLQITLLVQASQQFSVHSFDSH